MNTPCAAKTAAQTTWVFVGAFMKNSFILHQSEYSFQNLSFHRILNGNKSFRINMIALWDSAEIEWMCWHFTTFKLFLREMAFPHSFAMTSEEKSFDQDKLSISHSALFFAVPKRLVWKTEISNHKTFDDLDISIFAHTQIHRHTHSLNFSTIIANLVCNSNCLNSFVRIYYRVLWQRSKRDVELEKFQC